MKFLGQTSIDLSPAEERKVKDSTDQLPERSNSNNFHRNKPNMSGKYCFREYGSRKIIHIGLGRSSSAGSIKVDPQQNGGGGGGSGGDHSEPSTPTGRVSGALKGLLVGSSQGRAPSLRQRSYSVKAGHKQWLHPPDALLKGHILYTVKFLGECSVDQPKGTDVVKSAITKMKFNKHIKRAEGQKPPKIELMISADAVKVIDPKTKVTLHQYPLHRISYCADDKSDKRMFTFIGKAANSNDHFCYVFDSDKCAEEITLTIGQAFDLAYKRFLETTPIENDIRKQYLNLQKEATGLRFENEQLKKRISQLEKLKDRSDLEEYMRNNQIQDLNTVTLSLSQEESSTDDVYSTPETHKHKSVVGRRLENLILSDDASIPSSTPQTNGNQPHSSIPSSSSNNVTPILSPPPPNNRQHRANSQNRIQNLANTSSPAPVSSSQVDPFGMPAFNPSQVQQPASTSEPELMDMQAGFSRGLTFGTDDFSVNDFDPLSQRL